VPLSPALRRQLRARAHALKPVIWVGDAGVTDALLAEADRALSDHELVKVRLPAVDRTQRGVLAQRLCDALGAHEVQAIGRVRVIYRQRPRDEGRPARGRRSGDAVGGQRNQR